MVGMSEPQVLPCAPGISNLTVSNSAQAVDLTDSLSCSGGQFGVSWVGEVLLSRTIAVSDGTSLKVSGSSSGGSVIDGGGLHQLFNVSGGSTLDLEGLSLVNGASGWGGAVALVGSSALSLFDCSLYGNTASRGDGGMNLSPDEPASVFKLTHIHSPTLCTQSIEQVERTTCTGALEAFGIAQGTFQRRGSRWRVHPISKSRTSRPEPYSIKGSNSLPVDTSARAASCLGCFDAFPVATSESMRVPKGLLSGR